MTIEAPPPPRASWPDPPAQSDAGEVLTDFIIGTFGLNARLLDVAQELAGAGGLTAAWWQVLGGVIDRPRTVAEIGRSMGMTRQGVQRVADLLVDRGLATYEPNPAHRRAKLLACSRVRLLGDPADHHGPTSLGRRRRCRNRRRRVADRAPDDASPGRRPGDRPEARRGQDYSVTTGGPGCTVSP